jgi:hypothetical protein
VGDAGETGDERPRDVARLIEEGAWQAAIDAVIAHLEIDTSQVKGNVEYDPALAEEGATSRDGRVRIGGAAFRSAAWLASTIAHEVEVHVNRQAMAGRWYTDSEGAALQEIEAYDYELEHAAHFGLSVSEVVELRRRRLFYYQWLSPGCQAKADAGDYTM